MEISTFNNCFKKNHKIDHQLKFQSCFVIGWNWFSGRQKSAQVRASCVCVQIWTDFDFRSWEVCLNISKPMLLANKGMCIICKDLGARQRESFCWCTHFVEGINLHNPLQCPAQKYSRLKCLLLVKGLVICFYLGWSGSTKDTTIKICNDRRYVVTARTRPPLLPFFDHFWPFFWQNWGSDGHFEVLNGSEPQLVQKLWHKMQIYFFWLG